MRNRLIFLLLLLCAAATEAQVPSVTGSTLVPLREGNNAWIASLNTIFGAIDVDLTSGVTGILPVANGGTGLSTLAANRIPYGNGTSAFQSSANLTYDGSRFAAGLSSSTTAGVDLNGYTTSTLGSPVLTADFSQMRWFGTPTTATNNIDYRQLYIGGNISNDGTPTGGSLQSAVIETSIASPTRLANYSGIQSIISSTSSNVDVLYGLKVTATDWTTGSSLDNRTALNFDLYKRGDAVDIHTGRGIQGRVIDLSSTGRWSVGTAADLQVQQARTARALLASVTNSRGTGNTQYGSDISLTTSGSGVTSSTVYGHNVTISATSSGAITTAYAFRNTSSTSGITTAYNMYSSTDWRNYFNGVVSIGVDVTSAKLFVRGTGTTSGTYNFITEKSDGTDVFLIRDDGNAVLGPTTPSSTVRLIVRGSTADATAEGFEVQSSAGTPTFSVDNSGAVSVGNAAYQEKLTVNGKVRSDGLVLNSASDVTTDGHVIYNNASTNSGYFTIGDNSRAMAFIPAMIERHIIDYAVDWTTGRKGAFWTVPARFDGWKIAKAYIEVTSVGSGAGDDVVAIEIGGVTEGEQYVTAGTHTLVMDDVINTDDVITFNVTAISATPAKGLHISLELSKQ